MDVSTPHTWHPGPQIEKTIEQELIIIWKRNLLDLPPVFQT